MNDKKDRDVNNTKGTNSELHDSSERKDTASERSPGEPSASEGLARSAIAGIPANLFRWRFLLLVAYVAVSGSLVHHRIPPFNNIAPGSFPATTLIMTLLGAFLPPGGRHFIALLVVAAMVLNFKPFMLVAVPHLLVCLYGTAWALRRNR